MQLAFQLFTALYGMQTCSSHENVRLSVKRVHCDKTEKKDLSRFLYYTKDHLA